MLTGQHSTLRFERGLYRLLPTNPRCKICHAPFAGIGGRLMRLLGRRPWHKNPTVCNSCQGFAERHTGGAEIELSLFFADVRDSTRIAERSTPTEFRSLMNRFYATATEILISQAAWIDKLVGDEVIAFFIPGLLHDNHARVAIEAGEKLLRATGHGLNQTPWVPVGVGVHTGRAFVGTVGSGDVTDITALGDDVNTAARLASVARAGELLASEAAVAAAGIDASSRERRDLDLKGKSVSVPVRVLGP
jgi:adenylate cyclase